MTGHSGHIRNKSILYIDQDEADLIVWKLDQHSQRKIRKL